MTTLVGFYRRIFGVKSTREDGATMVEYGLMVALIAVVCLIAVTALGVSIQGVFTNIAGSV